MATRRRRASRRVKTCRRVKCGTRRRHRGRFAKKGG